ncbi:TPA: TIGR03752 family integrating conjugative element protein [Enterobacter hormaechei subsp. steigerwaltii]|nr:TIGR03752 family integrating conjugative element protein [Enterobacter hormaechei subsp. steigerwaltii]
MKILPVISPKGGEGKSTFAAYLAGFLADAGLNTLLVDADYSQPTASSIFALEHESPFGLYELLMQMVSDHTQCISQTAIKNLDVIYSNDPDELLPTAMLHAADGRLRLRNILQHSFFNRYDVIIVDSKGATGVMTELSLLSSNGLREQYDKRQAQLQNEQLSLTAKIQELTDKLKKPDSEKKTADSDIPLGLGLDGMGSSTGGSASQGSDGMMWVAPTDQKETDPRDAASGKASPQFPTSFLGENELTRQKAAYEEKVKGRTNEKGAEESAEPVYTLPENSTLVGSRAMTALLGRVPINGTVTDPYPFKVLIGKDNLTANGIELPDVEGAIVSGTASGDWTLSCVRGQVNSVTFVFSDGTVRTLPRPDTSNNAGGQNNNAQAKQDTGTSGGIGWISDENGIPCIGGERKSNASTYLPTIFGLSAAGAAGEAMSQGQYTTQNNVNGISATMTGDAGQAALGKAISGGMSETTDWIKQRYGMTFDAIYVPPGARLAVHITRQLAIDYEDKGRKVRYDFTLPGGVSDNGGLD